ncbi:hypothetical protein BVRB_008890 isoform A [Beta vulgaris subsp. vulgaris]|uniref:Uncharacterized protein n=1 Tax=Beta vulgaris subsp. vulgaris TaxID=3555 RepID=A0A0J8DWX6_BETVV|nr:hypothetical protein BVRB_008890 isoform A [Beta vulgaris subsp. vulgaris]
MIKYCHFIHAIIFFQFHINSSIEEMSLPHAFSRMCDHIFLLPAEKRFHLSKMHLWISLVDDQDPVG